ncbi:MAG: glycerophosphodiester phosphodiesterase family protein [Balneolaceae bacterium]
MATPQHPLRMPEWIAHRGLSASAPENTAASIQLAWLSGVDAVEVDVRLTADGEVVLFHDETLFRLCGLNRKPEEMSLTELRLLDVGSWKGEQWAGEKIPLLGDVMRDMPPEKRIYIEVKSGPDIISVLVELLNRSGLEDSQLSVIAFSMELASRVKSQRPQTAVYWICDLNDARREMNGKVRPGRLIDLVQKAGLDGLDLSFSHPARDGEIVRVVKEAGLGCYIWTVDNPESGQLAIEAGVDGITSNCPSLLREELVARNGRRLMQPPF